MNKSLNLAILSISMITVMASAAVSPALANISNAFPDASSSLIKTVLTLPSLFIIPFSLISGLLVQRFGNKKVLITGIIIYLIGGIAPVFSDTIPELLFWRAILGCGCGLIMPVSQTLIAINFEGAAKTKMTGYSGAASYLMGVIASFLVAPISTIDWHYSFYIYLVAILVLVINIVALPGDKPVSSIEKKQKQKLSSSVWGLIGMMFFINVAFYAVPANVALFMKEQAIGVAQSAGTVISVFMISGFIAGIVMSRLQQWLRSYTVLTGLGIMAAGYLQLSVASSLWLVVTGSGFVGFSFGLLFPSVLVQITNKCTAGSCIVALSISSCAQFLGQFLSPYLLQITKSAFGFHSLRYDFVILAVCLTTACLLYLAAKLVNRSAKTPEQTVTYRLNTLNHSLQYAYVINKRMLLKYSRKFQLSIARRNKSI